MDMVRAFLHIQEEYPSEQKAVEDGEGMPTTTAAELLVIAGKESPAIALDLERGRARLGNNGRFRR
jgi:hypothetical protein